jgi:uncharacterized membrane protein
VCHTLFWNYLLKGLVFIQGTRVPVAVGTVGVIVGVLVGLFGSIYAGYDKSSNLVPGIQFCEEFSCFLTFVTFNE